jgi:hypothetical protein
MTFISVDVEADGPAPGLYSMVCFGAVVIEPNLNRTFYGETSPISSIFIPEALAVSGVTREEHVAMEAPEVTMTHFFNWVQEVSKGNRPVFVSDNNGFDWQWINYYFWRYPGANPFGHSSRRIGDIYSGREKNLRASNSWKKFRKTKHDHNPVNDAIGNAEAFMKITEDFK